MPAARSAFSLTFLMLLTACMAAPPAIVSPPARPPEQVAALRSIQTRVVQVPMESVLPRAIDVLMDNSFVVRSVETKLGFISFDRQWTTTAPDQPPARVTEEGSIVFTPVAADSTQIRVSLTGSWNALLSGDENPFGIKGGAGQSVEETEYRKILDMLQAGLTKH